jgi:hypothetical protein
MNDNDFMNLAWRSDGDIVSDKTDWCDAGVGDHYIPVRLR